MRDLDLKLLRWMRTHGHTPAVEDAAVALGKAGNNGLVWVLLGLALAIIDNGRWESWLICALLGPFAIALNYAIKLAVKRPRPVLEGLPSLGGAPSSLSFPSAHATSSFGGISGRPRALPRPPLPRHALPVRRPRRRSPRHRPWPDRPAYFLMRTRS